jgi:hypothetical protein
MVNLVNGLVKFKPKLSWCRKNGGGRVVHSGKCCHGYLIWHFHCITYGHFLRSLRCILFSYGIAYVMWSRGIVYSVFNPCARWGGRPTPRSGRFTHGKESRYPLYKKLGGPQGRSGRVRKSHPTGVRTPDPPTLSQSLYPVGCPRTVI